MKTKEEKKAYMKAYRAANREKMRAQDAAYRAANLEKAKAGQAAWYAANSEKINERRRAQRVVNPEQEKRTVAAWRAVNSKKILAHDRMKKYGISPGAFHLMLLQQRNACGICKEIFSKEPHVDHCHKTGKVRGLLCGNCNRAMGLLKDSLEILESAKEYLRGC